MTIILSGVLPAGERNGLEAVLDELLNDVPEGQMIVARIRPKQITTKSGSGDVTVTARIVAIEAFPYESDAWTTASELLEIQRMQRTGLVPLPLGIGTDSVE